MEHQFDFIKNDELKNVFINAYKNDLTNTNDDDINVWAKNKINKINEECLKNWANTFDEETLLEEYDTIKNDLMEKKLIQFSKDHPITITRGEKNTINVPILASGGKRKTRKSRKSRRKPRKNKKSMKKSKK